MSEQLLPCPFCEVSDVYVAPSEFRAYVAACHRCGGSGPPARTPSRAKELWNRRASGWVSVEGRLPELDEPVWLWEAARGAWIGCRSDDADGWLWCNGYGSEHWNGERWELGESMADDDYRPTHFHPLPAPPAEPAPPHSEGGEDG